MINPIISRPLTVPNGLVGYWPLDDNTGTTARDLSGNGNNGTLSGSTIPTWVAGQIDRALSFNGSTAYVALPANSTLSPGSGNFTISAWIKFTAGVAFGYIFWNGSSALNRNTIQFGAPDGSALYSLLRDPSGQQVAVDAGTLNSGTWNHVALVLSNKTLTNYINGSSVGTNTNNSLGTINPSTPYIGVGNSLQSLSQYFSGSIDDVCIYNRALSSTEIAAKYNNGNVGVP